MTDLENRLIILEKNEFYTVKAIDNANAAATVITNKSLIKKSAGLGFVLSVMFVICRYCWRKVTEADII